MTQPEDRGRGALSETKLALLEHRLRKAGVTIAETIPRRPGTGRAELSYAQQCLWFLGQLEPGGATYNIAVGIRLSGRLDLVLLERSFNEVVRRHEALRTTFDAPAGRPVQVVRQELVLRLPVVDLRDRAGTEREAEVRRQSAAEARRGFDLGTGPLLRVRVLRLARDEHVVLLTMHHIVADGWSMGVLIREVSAIYAAFASGRPSPLPELPIQYSDFARWQRQVLGSEVLEAQLSYWKQQLRGCPPVLDLPADRARPAAQSYRGAVERFRVAGAVPAALVRLGRREEATLSMTLLAAFLALLGRYTGSEDLVVGMPVSGRNRREIEGLIGCFVNTLVIRTDLSGNPAVTALLARVRAITLEAFAHQDLPFERLVDELQPERSLSHHPLFQVMFVFQHQPRQQLQLPELTVRPLAVEGAVAKFDLTLSMSEAAGELEGELEFNTDLFAAPAIRRMAGHLGRLLAGVAGDPTARVGDLPLLAEAERHQLANEWNDTAAPVSDGTGGDASAACFHELFGVEAERRPDVVAVACGGERLSYGELERRASGLAARLARCGVGPEVTVALCFDRGVAMFVALLAVWKAGGAFLQLDPQHPAERLQFMLADSGARLLLSRREVLAALPPLSIPTLCVDDAEELRGGQPAPAAALPRALPENLAYLVYTSGSTGRPKGALEPHSAVIHILDAIRTATSVRAAGRGGGPDGTRRIGVVSSWIFDASIEQIVQGLLGNTLVVVPEEARVSAEEMVELLAREQLDLLEGAPAQVQTWLAAGLLERPGAAPGSLVVGGDVISEATWRALAAAPETVCWSVYGATEITVDSTWCRLAGERVILGRPLPRMQHHVLDRLAGVGMAPLPVGVAGELYLGGDGLARGYLGRADLTAERFVPNPFGNAGSRLYRTGDLVRCLADGSLEFLGRVDHQVKVRGFRIELGEIEAVLAAHPEVAQVVVEVREDRPAQRRLAAYVVGREGCRPEGGELRAYLGLRLPDYMVPQAFMVLEALPLTPNGKVDRRALPVPKASAEFGDGYVAPRTAAEQELARIWAQVLGAAEVGVEDNFFALGGDSILSIQVVSLAREAGYRLTVTQIFQQQTIAQLAKVAVPVAGAAARQEAVAGAVPLTPIQRWFFEQEPAVPHHFNQAVLLVLREPADGEALAGAVRTLLRHHDALRMRFERGAAGWQQWNQGPGDRGEAGEKEVFSQRDLSRQPEWQRALEADASRVQASLDLAAGPLLRVVHYRLGPAGERLLLVAHHLVVDGVSWRILLADLARAYEQLRAGSRPELPARTTSFRDWARRLAEHAGSSALATEAEHWLAPAAGAAGKLPRDHPDGANTVESSRKVSVAMSEEETRALLQQVPAAYRARTDEVLLAALAQAVARWTGHARMVVDLEGHGREELFPGVDLSRTVGWFTSLYPVLLDVSGCAGPGEVLKAVKEQVRGVPGRGIGYGLLRYLGPEPTRQRLAALPEAEISFNYLGQFDQALRREGAFGIADEPHGRSEAPAARRRYALDVDALVFEGRLRLGWTYSAALHGEPAIAALAGSFREGLRALIEHCLSPRAGGCTPSDFPLATLTQEQLDRRLGSGRGVEDVYPLSPMQQGMLFHSLAAPRSGLYVEQVSCRIGGDLDVPAFKRSWQTVVDRHPILRSAFWWEGLAEPLQVVRRQVELSWDERDWTALPDVRRRELLEELLRADRARGFPLDAAPLLRLSLLRVGPEAFEFVWSHHHALLDGWCTSLLFRELFTLYEAYRQGRDLHLAPPRPYRDFITWLRGQDRGQAEAFWRSVLAGFGAPTPLPERRSAATSAGEEETHREDLRRLPRGATAAVEAFARGQRLTLATVLQGAWALLLSRYAGEDDVVFGAVVSGRPAELAGSTSMLGLFINTLPVRVRLRPEQRVVDCLHALQEQQVEARRHEHCPLADVQRWSAVPPGTPLFESLLVFENYPVDASLRDEAGRALGIGAVSNHERSNYPLTLVVVPGAELTLRLDYDQRRCEPALVRRLLGHLAKLIEGMAGEPLARLSELALVTAAERSQILVEWNDTAAGYPAYACIHELFAATAVRTPDATAVVCEDAALSYGEIERRANRLGRRLRALGVGAEDRVAIWLERSPDLIVAQLAVWKAGAAYVPLDPAWPAERLSFLLADCGAPVILTQESLAARLPESGARVLRVDREGAALAHASARDPQLPKVAEQLAYVIYTSGSAGQPKGVEVTHAALANLIAWHQRAHGVTAADCATHLAGLAFDASVWEVWPYLTAGACICLPSEETLALPGALIEYLARQQVTIAFLPTPLAEVAMQEPWPSDAALRRLLTGGDRLHFAPREGLPWRLVNQYGPTENTVVATWTEVPPGTPGAPPIGRPIDNVQAYVLDRQLRLVPVGVAGEMAIGGDSLARGYLGRPSLTAEQLVPDPWSLRPGARLYRTGDLVRYCPDGNLEFLGRIDHQVKVRGYRIELGEIESVLGKHPAVRATAVLARADGEGGLRRRLVAYVVQDPQRAAAIDELRDFLCQRLPDYMVPAVFMELGALPLTANGKVDRRALPAPDAGAASGRRRVAPRTAVEAALARIWSEVLGVEEVGVEDSFFALGGDSILSLHVVARAREAGYQLTVKQIFQQQTIARLAALATPAAGPVASQEAVSGPVALTPIQRWFFEQELGSSHHFNQTVLLALREPADVPALTGAVRELVRRHDALRLRFARQAEDWRQWSEGTGEDGEDGGADAAGVFSQVDLWGEPDWRGALAADGSRVQASLDLAAGPLLRVVHYKLGPAGERLLVVVHHLAVDAVSWRILLADLTRAYDQLRGGRRAELPPKTTSFQEWALRLAGHAGSDALAAETEHWLAAAGREVVSLPVDHADGANTVGSSRRLSVSLSEEETRCLLQDVPGTYRTRIDEVLLAALVAALSAWTGQSRLLLDLEGHGREDLFSGVDLSRTVGWFTSLYPVVLEAAGWDGPGETLKAVKEQLRTVPQHGIGYGLLRYLGPEPTRQRLAALPAAEIGFNHLGQLDQALPSASPFTVAAEAHGRAEAPEARRRYVLEVEAFVLEGRLRLGWTYGARHDEPTIAALATSSLAALRGLIEHCRSPQAGGCTPSDFPLASLTQDEIDRCVGNGRGVEDLYPLSPAQEGLLFHSLYAPRSGMYVVQSSCRFGGGLDVAAFKRSWQTVVDRHPILRTAFIWEGLREPRQVVRRDVALVWEADDWRALNPEQLRRRLAEWLRVDRERGFDVGRAPLMRLALHRTGTDSHQFVWSHHHLLLDGWCIGLLFKELFACYESYRRGEAPRLEQPRPYRDYVAWLRSQDLGRAEEFWRRALHGFASPTRLAASGGQARAGAGSEAAFGQETLRLPAASTRQLEVLARRRQVTLNTVLQGAWALLLGHYAGQDDVVFGATVSGRPAELAGATAMMGLFINTLPVRVRVKPWQRALDFLVALQEEQAEARQYEYSALVDVHGWSEVPRGMPLFESLLVFENYPVDASLRESAGETLGISAVRTDERTNYPLTLVATPGAELQVCFDYERGRFEATTVRGIARHLGVLLEGMAAHPEGRLMDLPLLHPAERQQLLVEWNATGVEELWPESLPELLERQVGQVPDAVAVAFGEARLSYGELERRARRLARRLEGLGVGPEALVGICMERSLEMVVGLLAVLKAGGAYLPLDPEYPRERLAMMLADSGARVVLAQRRLHEALSGWDGRSVWLDDDGEAGAAEEEGNGECGERRAGADNLAYVIYTSGSTGLPKGVEVRHRSLVNFVVDMVRRLGLGRGDRLLSVTSLSFDIFGVELWVPLACGGQVRLASRDATLDGALLARTLAEMEATVLQSTPATWRLLLAAGWTGTPQLRLLCTGEALAGELAERLLDKGRELWNLYGPTETTIWSAVHRVELAREPMPIGRPIANTALYVLDGWGQPVPVGVAGELCIGGDGLARGYLGRRELTAERFVPDPFAGRGARLYRTGDLARHLPDGTLEFLGRIDHQVKLRGFRIEPGEIEAVLAAQPGVEQVVVVAREDPPGDPRLVAYVTGREAVMPGIEELRRRLADRLPAHMVPSAFVLLERLPLTPNGKLDRRALPAPGGDRPQLASRYVAPRNAVEELLAGIWAELLGLARVGIDDRFLDLGGHSLMATRLVARVRARLGVDIALRTLFETQTIAALAEVIGRTPQITGEQAGPIRRVPRPFSVSPVSKAPAVGGE